MALTGALLSLWITGHSINVFSEIGIIMLIGLITKNGILIVEFANQRKEEGLSVSDAVLAAASSRFRPILMTSFAFIAGLIPLVVATGPGAVGNRTIGASALGGMLFGTVFGVIIVPGLYFIFGTLADAVASKAKPTVIVVKTKQSLGLATFEELRASEGTLAHADAYVERSRSLPVVVDKWFAENTFHAHEFSDIRKLVGLKERHGVTISVGLPALNEEKTIGTVIKRVTVVSNGAR